MKYPDQLVAQFKRVSAEHPEWGARKLGDALGISRDKARSLMVATGKTPTAPAKPTVPELTREEKDDKITVNLVSRVKTVPEAVARSGVDLAIWEVSRSQVTTYEVGMKLKQEDGSDAVHVEPLWRVFVEFRRKVPKSIEQAAEMLIARLEGRMPAPEVVKLPKLKSAGCLYEISVPDAHFAKLAWRGETGNDYDLALAQSAFAEAVDTLLDDVSGHDIAEIIFPVGSDFFHVDSDANTTAAGTPQDVDGRYAKMVAAGCDSVVAAIEKARRVAPVKVLWVPGNHDPRTSWWLVRYLQAWFRNTAGVVIDNDARSRKYHLFGNTLIGFTHGNEEAHRDLPNIMATEVPQLWAGSKTREWHLGHLHKVKETRHVSADTFGSVVVRILPSISGTDGWHFRRGYVGGQRAAQGFLYHPAEGLRAVFTAPATPNTHE